MAMAETSEERVDFALDEAGIAHVQLLRPDKLNALDDAMFDALIAAGERLAALPQLRCVVLSGQGRAFCAGLDLSMFGTLTGDAPPLVQRSHGDTNRFQQVAMQWRSLPVPVIAAVHGVCFGGGLQIAGGADIRIVAANTRLAVMEMKWGIIPDMGGFALWRGMVREDILRELTYTAREFSGEDALAWGFATHLDADPLARAMALAHDIAAKDPAAVRAAKALFNRVPDLTTADILLGESAAQDALLAAKRA